MKAGKPGAGGGNNFPRAEGRISVPPLSHYFPIHIRPGKPGLISFLLASSILFTMRCGPRVYLVSSLGSPQAIAVDGDSRDWTGALSYAPNDHLFVGFVNNRDDLYVCLTTEAGERGGPMPRATWTVWFDPSGATNKTLGLRLTRPEAPPRDGPGGPGQRPGRKPDAKPDEMLPADSEDRVEIIGPKGDVIKKMSLKEAAEQGLEIREGYSGDGFVLEIKIPLVTSDGHTVAVGATPNGVVGIGFMSSRPDLKDWREGPPGGGTGGRGKGPGDISMPGGAGPGGGTRGGMGGHGGGMPGGFRSGMNLDIPKDVKFWTRVKLLATDQPEPSKVLSLSIE